jgi:formate-dependent nitrite reductase cytochrome c552 subunit
MTEKRIGDAHQNVEPAHPKQTGARCSTCHATDNVELLALENGERATLDATYRLCAQCHFEQVDAWAAGVHGKRLDGWQGRRVVAGCPDCHDPHKPALEPRIPFRPPQVERIGGQEQ